MNALLPSNILAPRAHQTEALKAVSELLADASRATVVMPCGSGKTLLEIWISENLNPKTVVVFAPTLLLISQLMEQWKLHARWNKFSTLCVCSDPSISGDDIVISSVQACTDPLRVREFMDALRDGEKLSGVIFCTYHSAHVLGAALKDSDHSFDVGIFDEAHKTVGVLEKRSGFALHDLNLPISKRIFFTATPKVLQELTTIDELEEIEPIASMDNELIYGEHAYVLTMSEAVRRGIVLPYKIVISLIAQLEEGETKPLNTSIELATAALSRAIANHNCKKIVTYHNRVNAALEFAEIAKLSFPDFQVEHISGYQKATVRESALLRYEKCKKGVLTNARCLVEGIDVPAIDLVAFMSMRKSEVDIVQAVGRSIRKDGNDKPCGYVFIPIHADLSSGDSIETAIKKSDFRTIIDVLRKLAEGNDYLTQVISWATINKNTDDSPTLFATEHIEIDLPLTLHDVDKVKMWSTLVQTRIIDSLGDAWDKNYVRARTHLAEHGNYAFQSGALKAWFNDERRKLGLLGYPDTRRQLMLEIGVSVDVEVFHKNFDFHIEELKRYKLQHGSPNISPGENTTGDWLLFVRSNLPFLSSKQRQILVGIGVSLQGKNEKHWQGYYSKLISIKTMEDAANTPNSKDFWNWLLRQKEWSAIPGRLPVHRAIQLEKSWFYKEICSQIGVDYRWTRQFLLLKEFYDVHGHSNAPQTWKTGGNPLGTWCAAQRQDAKDPKYPPHRRALLTTINFRFEIIKWDSTWDSMYALLVAFKAKYGHCSVPLSDALGNKSFTGWFKTQVEYVKKPTYRDDRRRLLTEIGFFETNRSDSSWVSYFCAIQTCKEQNLSLNAWQITWLRKQVRDFQTPSFRPQYWFLLKVLYPEFPICMDLPEEKKSAVFITRHKNDLGLDSRLKSEFASKYSHISEDDPGCAENFEDVDVQSFIERM